MIIEFDITEIDGGYLAIAVMHEEPSVEIGLFDEFEDAATACNEFQIEHSKRLH